MNTSISNAYRNNLKFRTYPERYFCAFTRTSNVKPCFGYGIVLQFRDSSSANAILRSEKRLLKCVLRELISRSAKARSGIVFLSNSRVLTIGIGNRRALCFFPSCRVCSVQRKLPSSSTLARTRVQRKITFVPFTSE